MLILKTFLQYVTDLDFPGLFGKIIRSIFLALDGVVYAVISYCYDVFNYISEIRVFENSEMIDLANRIYILIGVISLFLVAYALISAIINPDNATKGKNSSFSGIVKGIIFAVIGIAIVPTLFDYAYEFQSRVLCNNVIQKFFLENNVAKDDEAQPKMGAEMSLYLFKSFYYIKGSEDDTSLDENNNSNWDSAAQNIVADNDSSYNLLAAFNYIEEGQKSISEALGDFDDSITNGQIGYIFLISTIAGAFAAYVLLGFVIDMGVRAVKLAYLQLIAPLPIMTVILPNQKKVFDAWSKKTISCFIEVFVRIIAMSFAFYAIKYLRPWIFGDMSTVSCGRTVAGVTKLLAQAAFIIGVFAFMRQLPKLIKDLLPGFDSSGFKLGFGKAFTEAGGFQALGTAGGIAGAGLNYVAGAARNLGRGVKAAKNAWDYGKQNGATAGLKRFGRSTVNGLQTIASGAADLPRVAKAGYYGYKNTENAKSMEELKSGIGNGVEQAMSEEGIISKTIGAASENFKAFAGMVTTEHGGANRFDSRKELKKASTMDNIKSIIDSMKSTSDAINSTKIKNLEQLYQTEVSQIQEKYKNDMATAANIADATKRQQEEIKIRDEARKAISRAQDSLDFEKRSIQNATLKGNNAQIVEYRKKLANEIKDNYGLILESMSIANSNDEYIKIAKDEKFIDNILKGSAFDDVVINNQQKKSVVLELGTDLGVASNQKKTAAVEQPKKKDTK